ncbi:HOOK3_2 [Blepharisma stoltei]|uniref:Calponin-homology (CH) domain-containing protein n=1 Tax=Blepharisma stoltei TaxID=1481888 RepID=A0AAU9JER8_9CILI|nr:unnamed protein product [Blepharisma stoltei]
MNKLESSLVSWINSNNLSYGCHSIDDLSDGLLLYEFMSQISPDTFQSQLSEDSFNASAKTTNLNKLLRGLETFYYEELGKDFSNLFQNIDTSAIARNNDRSQLLSLLELIMGAAIKCKNKETYIARIVSQNEAVQSELMGFIENVLSKLENYSYNEDKDIRAELMNLKQEKRTLKMQLDDAKKELEDLSYRQDDLMLDRDRLLNRVRELEAELDKKVSKKGNSDISILTVQLEAQINQKEITIQELKNQINDLKKQHQGEILKLRDELDMAHEKIIQLSKAEATLDIYKKRLEELNQYKIKVKDIQDERDSLKDKLAQYEEDVNGAHSLEQTLNYYKEQFSAEKEKSATLLLSLDEKEKILKECQKAKKELEEKRQFLEAKNKELNEEIEQLRFGGETSNDSFSLNKGFQSELEERINFLSAENKILKSQMGNQRILQELNEQMDIAILAKKTAEENLLNERKLTRKKTQEIDALNDEVANLREGLRKLEEDNQTAETMIHNMRNSIKQLEKEKSELIESKTELDKLKVEKESHSLEMKNLFREKEEIIQRLMACKEEVHKLENQLTQKEIMLKSAQIDLEQAQHRVSVAQEKEKFALSQLEALKKKETDELEGLSKIKLLEMERDIMKTNKEIAVCMLELKEKDSLIASLQAEKNKLEEDLKNSISKVDEINSQKSKEEILALKDFIKQKELEIEYLVTEKEESKIAYDKEMKLMSIIVHEIGCEIMKNRPKKSE